MIQRIQTLYLLIVAALMAVTLFAPLAWFGLGGEELTLHAFALRSASGEIVRPPIWTGLLLTLACALPLVCLLFTWLALRAIFRDEMLVRSLNRIR